MTRTSPVLGLAVLLSASIAPTPAHGDQSASSREGVCAVLDAHPGWAQAVAGAANRWGAPPALLLSFIRQESNFRAGLGRKAGVYGYAQAAPATWALYRQDSDRPDADRNNFADSIDFVAWYVSGTLERTGAPYSKVAAHYLAYSRGPAPIGPAHMGSLRNAARVVGYAKAYERDLAACPLATPPSNTQVASLGG